MNEQLISTPPKINKPEPVCNDSGVCFLGETDSLISYSDLYIHFNVDKGSLNTTSEADKWLHFTIDDKELYISKVSVGRSLSWGDLYSKGLVYGTDDNGLYPVGAPVNQYKTIQIKDRLYKCRLPKALNDDLDVMTSIIGYDVANTELSEWSRLFYPIVIDDPNMSSYTGPRLAEYTIDDLQLEYINQSSTPGSLCYCQETSSDNLNGRFVRGAYGSSYINTRSITTNYGSDGWRAILELIG